MTASLEEQFNALLLRVGRLNYTWTNTESLLVHLIAGLCGTKTDAALVIFLTLNTTRARVELVERLAKLDGADPAVRDDILACTHALMRQAPLRNRYNHCIYSFDKTAGTAQTILMRIADRKNHLKIGQTEAVDETALEDLETAINAIHEVNLQLWVVIRKYEFPF